MSLVFAPEVLRQRLLVEGYYDVDRVNKDVIREFFKFITTKLSLRVYGEPIIFSPGGEGKTENQGYDAFIPLIDSGICLYVWTEKKFVSSIIYTCKHFDEELAYDAFKTYFKLITCDRKSF
jgi:S-adenosylmethionine/arginine decarboxylase-like enzyme